MYNVIQMSAVDDAIMNICIDLRYFNDRDKKKSRKNTANLPSSDIVIKVMKY